MRTDYLHFMVDIETMGPPPNGAILSVGIVPFNLKPGKMEIAPKKFWFDETCSLKANQAAGRVIDADTVEWWLQQDKDAQEMLFVGQARHETFSRLMFSIISYFNQFPDYELRRVWAKPPQYDLDILENAFQQIGHDKEVCWTRRAARDLRTVLDRAEFEGRDDVLELERVGIKHSSVWDAHHQARQVILAYSERRLERSTRLMHDTGSEV